MTDLLSKLNQPPTFLEQAMAEQSALLASIPEDHDAVMVTVIDDRGARVGFAARLGAGWTAGGELERKWNGRGIDKRIIIGKSFKKR